ncbi:MAG TPA: helix-turn-helix domain-containing protein [Steroidobacteraceae bacterium]
MARPRAVPVFHLYGEPHRTAAERFVHVENLHDRSRPSKWLIRPHAHTQLSHIFLVLRGGGAMQAEERTLAFTAPSLLIVPAGVVHGFKWRWESRGSVITLADSYLEDLVRRDTYVEELLRTPRAIELAAEDVASLERDRSLLSKELSHAARGYRAAVDSAVLSIAVTALRRAGHLSDARTVTPGHHAALVARFRARIEKHYRLRERVPAYAKALGVSATALRIACARVAGMPPTAILDQRALLEAKRALLYSNRSITELSFHLGFVDPAYFSRWFHGHVGRSPRRFRAQHGQ